jgi:hypothetical protein
MKALVTALKEIYGLFVEDGSLAVAILVWAMIAVLLFPRIPGSGEWRGPLFFIGLALLLVENVRRAAHR